jgi:hypothetical protein
MIASWPASQDVHGRKVEIADQYRRKGIGKADAWGIQVTIYQKRNVESPSAISGQARSHINLLRGNPSLFLQVDLGFEPVVYSENSNCTKSLGGALQP